MVDAEAIRGARILVVDDEPANLALVRQVLAREGYRHVTTEADPRAAVARVREGAPDLVVLDLMMPGLDGYAVLDAVHRLTPPDDLLPILVLTADTRVEARRRALALGARDVMTKPIDVFEFGLRAGNLLQLRFLVAALRAGRGRTGGDAEGPEG